MSVNGLVQIIFWEIDRDLRKEVVLAQDGSPGKGNWGSEYEISHSSKENRGDSTYLKKLYALVDRAMERGPEEDTKIQLESIAQ